MPRHNIPHVDKDHDALTQAHALEEVARAVKHGEVHFESPIQVNSKADLLAAVNAMPEFAGTFVGAVRVDH